jgi:rare lipoprotein A
MQCAFPRIDEPAPAAARSRIDAAPRSLLLTAQRASMRGAPALMLALAMLAAVLTLAGCGSAPKRGGGFYQDDGPPRDVPRDLERTPDATPRVEPFHPFANRPYTALGRSFTPVTDDRPMRQRGYASWYGRQFHGNRTAIGERYDMFAMTAAHPTMPLPSYARVTNTRSGASVIVRVNDRGPFKHDRVIDLSYAAATRLGFANAGTVEVEVVRLTHADIRAGRFGSSSAGREDAPRAPVALRSPVPLPPPASVEPAAAAGVAVAAAVASPVAANVSAGTTTSAPTSLPMPAGTWAVQLGAFDVAANADALRDRLALLLSSADGFAAEERAPRVQRDGGVHRVLLGQFGRRDDAQALATRLERALERDTSLYLAR